MPDRLLLQSSDRTAARRAPKRAASRSTKDSDLVADGYTAVGSAYTLRRRRAVPARHRLRPALFGGQGHAPISRSSCSSRSATGRRTRRRCRTSSSRARTAACTSTRPTSPRIQIAVAKTSGTKAIAPLHLPRHRRRLDGRLRLVGELLGATPSATTPSASWAPIPGPDMTYTLGMIHDFFFSGFCTAADGASKIGAAVRAHAPAARRSGRAHVDVRVVPLRAGRGRGADAAPLALHARQPRPGARAWATASTTTPTRRICRRASRPRRWRCRRADACAHADRAARTSSTSATTPTARTTSSPSATATTRDAVGFGKFDPTVPRRPIRRRSSLAVDVNGNGKRDSGEPVLVQGNEPFDDVGTDGARRRRRARLRPGRQPRSERRRLSLSMEPHRHREQLAI